MAAVAAMTLVVVPSGYRLLYVIPAQAGIHANLGRRFW
jgi:hypothetical protein